MPKHWIDPPPTHPAVPELGASAGVSPFLAQILLTRGVGSAAEARRFLNPDLEHLHDPFLLPGMRPAVERIVRALDAGERILVHGDYDVDGVCAAALLTRVLRVLKANVEVFVPHRQQEGFDLQPETVARAAADGVRLLITVDCGILAMEAAERARELGVDLIVTDHHEPSPDGSLPPAVAVVNPRCPGSRYPFWDLCGTGVAFKLASALVQRRGVASPSFRTAFLDLVALATCADCMPLVDENRVFVHHGLQTLRGTNKAGLKALMEVASLAPAAVTARSLGFVLGPRINAIGRMDAAAHALRLLLTADGGEARSLAELLDEANRERQQEQERILQEALRQAERFLDDRVLILGSQRWHPGIIGIVASKLAESLCRPTMLVALSEESGRGRGSCRSVEGFDIAAALHSCRGHLLRAGGHKAAAGFDILAENLEPFRRAMQEEAARSLPEEMLRPTLRIDAEVPAAALDLALARELERLEPYGHGNPEPVLLTHGLGVLEQRRLTARNGSPADHLKLRLRAGRSPRGVEALFWRTWARAAECPPNSRIDVCYMLGVNTYGGAQTVQLTLQDFRPCAG